MFVARVASLFALLVLSHAQSQCGTDSKGYTWQHAVNLPDVTMPAGFNDFNYDIPDNICSPYNSYHVGTTATACDAVLQPRVLLTSLRHVQVSRPGFALLPGVLHLTVYCQDVLPKQAGF